MKTNSEILNERNNIVVYDNSLKNTLDYFNIDSLYKVFPYSKNDTLQRLYGFITSNENFQEIFYGLRNIESIEDVHLKEEEELISLYDPSDYMWYVTGQNGIPWLWHLKKIQANLAWDITKGDPSIKIAIIDTWFDINHPDLYNQLLYHYDPYDNQPFYSSGAHSNHGTTVASFAAAETDGGGQLASIGFNCKIIPYKAWAGNYLQRAQHASLVMNADVLTSSAGGWNCNNNFNDFERIAVKEILDNGTVIIMPAGNGWNGTHCAVNGELTAFRPLHPYYDERIIMVTSTDVDDKHYNFDPSTNTDKTHSHYPSVDICAPGYRTMGATSTLNSDGTLNTWPYYGSMTGTSYAAPIVAGLCGLLKSINKCFTSEDIQHIIKTTAYPVADANLFPGLLGAGRVNAYQAVQMALTYLNNITVSNSQYWANPRNIYSDIVINAGATLTITTTVKMADNRKITIKPGGKLVVDGGKITSACPDRMWYGLHVSGNINLPQTAQNQGTLELKNGAVIENLRNGISTYETDANGNINWSSMGGIIKADNATFRNNRRSVEFMTYPPDGTNPIPQNVSYFKNCTFIIDDNNIFASSNANYYTHISMWQVSGVKIQGCTFENNITNMQDRKYAMFTLNAGYTVDEFCTTMHMSNCNCSNPKPSEFKGFNRAIESTNSNKQYTIKIDRSKFEKNITGVRLDGKNSFQISRLNMNLNPIQGSYPYGIYLNSCLSDYKVEANEIYSSVSNFATGILAYKAGTNENRIYRNTINNTYYGIAVANNYLAYPATPNILRSQPLTGLQFVCNDFSSNTNDIYVTSDAQIRYLQGFSNSGADNRFNLPRATYNFYLGGQLPIIYYYDYSNPMLEPVNRTNNVALLNGSGNTCVNTLCDYIIKELDFDIGKSENSYLEKYRYANNIYDEMTHHFYDKGYDKVLSDYSAGIIGFEELLKEVLPYLERMSTVSQYMSELSREALLTLKMDSIIDLTQIRDWYEEINTINAKYSLAETYYQLGEFEDGFRTLDLIPKMFELNENEMVEHRNYVSFFTFKNRIREDERNIAQLNEEEIEQMVYFANASDGLSSVMARGILCFFYDICFEIEIEEKNPDKKSANGKQGIENRTSLSTQNSNSKLENITLYPNPTTGELIIVNGELKVDKIVVHDIVGKIVSSHQFTNSLSYQKIDISNLNSGIYFVRITIEAGEIVRKIVKH